MAENKKMVDVAKVLKDNGNTTVEESTNHIVLATSAVSIDTAIGDNLYGINHRQTPGAVPINKDGYGLTFFTRPALNMQTENIRAHRQFLPLLSTEKSSLQRVIRCLLDPRLQRSGLPCDFVDPDMAFIPVLSNNLLSISGWPDVEVDTFTSQPGAYKEAWFMVDSVAQNLSTYDITANFRNIEGDPITALIFYWIHYASLVYQGRLVPYPEYIIENEIDYLTRIYRLVLDKNKRFVQKIGCTGIAAPLSAPFGASLNYEAGTPLNLSNNQLSIPFRCAGAIYQDDIVIYTFNRTQAEFNSEMRDELFKAVPGKRGINGQVEYTYSHPRYKQIPIEALDLFNNRGYPRIDPETYELQWWVPGDLYKERLAIYTEQSKKP